VKIALLTAAKPELVKVWVCQESSPGGSLLPPVDLASIAAMAKKLGIDARILDLRLQADPHAWLKEWVEREKPDAVLLNLTTTSAHWDFALLASLPAGINRLVFGTHAQSNREECFSQGVHGIFLGDPEAVLEAWQNHRYDLDACPGLLTPQAPQKAPLTIENLDLLPFPDLAPLELSRYSAPYVQRGNRFTILLSSRGCPFHCTYCLYPTLFGAKARSRSVKNVVDEMEHDLRQFGIREFYFLDATFNLGKDRILALCAEILSRGLRVSWTCNMRVSPVDEALLAQMKAAGCRWIFFGVEDQDLLRETKKGTSVSATQTAFRLAREAGIQTMAFLMVFPREDISEDEYVKHIGATIRVLDADAFQCNVAIPFPGTALFDEFKAKYPDLRLDWRQFDPHGESLPYQSKLDLHRIKRRVYRDFLLRHPLKVARVAWQMDPKALLRQAMVYVKENILA
jgi:radical SAM superfamily enzyme YgiQ (UPF0313 family)